LPLFMIIDNYPMLQAGLCALLRSRFEGAQCMTCSSLEEAIDSLNKQTPNIIFVDLSLPGMQGVQAIKHLHHAYQGIPVVVFSASQESGIKQRCMEAGAAGFLSKLKSEHHITDVIQNILENKAYYSQIHLASSRERQFQLKYAQSLTKRQKEVLQLMHTGRQYKQIAFELGCSENTIKVHSRGIFSALAVNNRQQAVDKALRLGVFD